MDVLEIIKPQIEAMNDMYAQGQSDAKAELCRRINAIDRSLSPSEYATEVCRIVAEFI